MGEDEPIEFRAGRRAESITIDDTTTTSCCCRPRYRKVNTLYGVLVYEDGYFHYQADTWVADAHPISYNARYVREVSWKRPPVGEPDAKPSEQPPKSGASPQHSAPSGQEVA